MEASLESERESLLNRREAIRRVSALLGGLAFVGGNNLLVAAESARPATDGAVGGFSVQDIAFLDEIAETILPATKTPGAKAAKTGAFMALMVTDCYGPAEQKVFREGMQKVDDAMKQANHVSFMVAAPPQRLAVLTSLDHEQKRVMDAREAADRKQKGLAPLPGAPAAAPAADIKAPVHYFRMMKELTLLGFFTSKAGCTQALRYVEVPGRFEPCIPYAAGEAAWAAHA
jgi:glucoside 3-dehydrogenase (cytochrome c) hitch-hiker subunit